MDGPMRLVRRFLGRRKMKKVLKWDLLFYHMLHRTDSPEIYSFGLALIAAYSDRRERIEPFL